MTIEFRPKSLASVIELPGAQRRFRNREGYGVGLDEKGKIVWTMEGLLLEISRSARQYDALNPNHKVIVYSQVCSGHTFTPDLPKISSATRV